MERHCVNDTLNISRSWKLTCGNSIYLYSLSPNFAYVKVCIFLPQWRINVCMYLVIYASTPGDYGDCLTQIYINTQRYTCSSPEKLILTLFRNVEFGLRYLFHMLDVYATGAYFKPIIKSDFSYGKVTQHKQWRSQGLEIGRAQGVWGTKAPPQRGSELVPRWGSESKISKSQNTDCS